MSVAAGADTLNAVADRRKKADAEPAPESRRRSGESIQGFIDPDIRAAVNEYMATHNAEAEHKATVTSVLEAALKMYLSSKGHWPRRKPKPA
jgi:hypothetical protein